MSTNEENDARLQYQQLVNEYGAALTNRDVRAPDLFTRASAAWDRLRSFKGEEADMDADVHLVAALTFAIRADDAAEAKRLYESMSEKYKELTDRAETLKPGTLKIWMSVKDIN